MKIYVQDKNIYHFKYRGKLSGSYLQKTLVIYKYKQNIVRDNEVACLR
jgi:hypothetical protein